MIKRVKKWLDKTENKILACYILGVVMMFLFAIFMMCNSGAYQVSDKLDPSKVMNSNYNLAIKAYTMFFEMISVGILAFYGFSFIFTSFISLILSIGANFSLSGESKKWKKTLYKVLSVLAVIPYFGLIFLLLISIVLSLGINIIGLIASITVLILTITLLIYIFMFMSKKNVELVDKKK